MIINIIDLLFNIELNACNNIISNKNKLINGIDENQKIEKKKFKLALYLSPILYQRSVFFTALRNITIKEYTNIILY